MKRISVIPLFILLALAGCKEEYDFPLRGADQNLLVVDGMINAGDGPTTITLSRSLNLDDVVQFKPVLQAELTVEGEDNTIKPLSAAGNGKYTSDALNLNLGTDYRLRIKTFDGKEYLSEWVTAKRTPEMDSVTWERSEDGLTIFNHTHDPLNETRYYRWEHDETWQINSFYTSDFKWVGGSTIVQMPFQDLPNTCYKYSSSNNIMVGSSAQYQSDVISKLPVYFIPLYNEKISVRYSVNMKQHALTKAAYEYFALMKKNTESLGTIFDPQPSELRGNIFNVSDPSEIVIGFISVSEVTEKRMFVTSIEANWPFHQICETITIDNHPDTIKKYVPMYLPWGSVEPFFPGVITHYLLSTPECVDCTVRGGSMTKPSYW